MTRLATSYLGLELRSPLVASASPFTRQPESALRLQEAGAAAVVLPSLFEEEVVSEELELSRALEQGAESFAEALDYHPAVDAFESTADRYLTTIGKAKEQLDVPVIASLNATSSGGWVRYAKLIEEAGADALELNLYRLAADPARTGSAMEAGDLEVIRRVRESTALPLAVKLSPYYSALASFALSVAEAGADGLVLFNRFYQPDLNLDELEVQPSVLLSTPQALRLPLRWLAILHGKIRADLAGTSGVHTAQDVLKMLMAGANCTMIASALLLRGVDHLRTMEQGLREWMEQHWYDSVEQMQGSMSQLKCPNPTAFERAQYMRAITSFKPTV